MFLLKNLNRNAHCGCPVTSASWADDTASLLKMVYFLVFFGNCLIATGWSNSVYRVVDESREGSKSGERRGGGDKLSLLVTCCVPDEAGS